MDGSVGTTVEIRLLGPVTVLHGATVAALPRSRKVRALLGYLALSPQPVGRSRLCDLLWDVPNDPRGELRWCLSKLRALLDEPKRRRVVTSDDRVGLDLSDVRVDALDVDRAAQAGFEHAGAAALAALSARFGGDLLDGIELDGSPELTGWLTAQRARYRSLHVELLRALVASGGASAETFARLHAWLQLAPFDMRAHEVMLDALARAGRMRDADDHLSATIRAFEAEGLDWVPLRDAWHAARTTIAPAPAPRIEVAAAAPVVPAPRRARASVAVMPLVERDSADGASRLGAGLTEDIIMQLARLRVLFVIARGSVFALAERGVDPTEAARILGVDYLVGGTVRRDGDALSVVAELADARDGRILWTEQLHARAGDTLAMLGSIVERIVAAVADGIESEEARRAVLKPPSSLDAWEAYHRGLWHMYKFTGADNREAAQFFRTSLERDPTFARAHAGLSFTHFQNVFLELVPDRARQIELAFETAQHSLAADGHDPAAHWAMGRALWLRGDHGESIAELERCIELSPNFALGHYTLGFVHCQAGDPNIAIAESTTSRELSPFDPLQFAMLTIRALAHLRLGEAAEAAEWAMKGVARPNAHFNILSIAALCLANANRRDEARRMVARTRAIVPDYSIDQLTRAYRLAPDLERMLRQLAPGIGL